MLFRRLFLCTLGSLIWTGTATASDTSFRDSLIKNDPRFSQATKLLEITPLEPKPGRPVLRIWDINSSTTVRVKADRTTVDIVWGHGETWSDMVAKHHGRSPQSKNPALPLETKKHRFEFTDAALAKDVEYVLSRINEFRSSDRGLDGGYTFVEAVNAAGAFSTFELWSPDETKWPLAADLEHLHWTFRYCVELTSASDENWKSHEKANFMTRFSGVSGVNLTREKARAAVGNGLKDRLVNLAAALRRVPTP